MKLNQRDFFKERLGVGLKNPQWSWGAFDPASNRVFLRIWKNQKGVSPGFTQGQETKSKM
jgi:hypothetical protein